MIRDIMNEQKNAWGTLTTKAKVVTGTIGAVAVLSIFGVGASPEPEAAPKPEPVVKTVTETVETVPSSCLTAIDKAEAMAELSSQFAFAMADTATNAEQAIMAAATGDAAAMNAVGDKQEAVNKKVDSLNSNMEKVAKAFNTAKAECRAAEEET